MTALGNRTTTLERPIVRCGLCGREIHPDSASVPIWDKVGGHCKSRLLAMTATLEREGLGEFLTGPVTFEPVESEDAHGVSNWEFPPYIIAMRDRAERLGLRFDWHWPRLDGPATCELKLPQGDKAKRRLLGKLERLGVAA